MRQMFGEAWVCLREAGTALGEPKKGVKGMKGLFVLPPAAVLLATI
jgi:hypothetical protein